LRHYTVAIGVDPGKPINRDLVDHLVNHLVTCPIVALPTGRV